MKSAWGLVLLLVGGTSLAAEGLTAPDLGRYVRWGPLRVRPGLQLREIGHDDNILATDEKRVADWRATIGPRLEGLVLLGSRGFLTFDEKLEFTLFKDNGDQNYTDQRGQARLTLPFGRAGVFLEGTLNHVNERPVDREDLRPQRNEYGGTIGGILESGSRTDIQLARSRTAIRYHDPDEPEGSDTTIDERLDRTERWTKLDVRYRVTGRTRLTFAAETVDIDFDSPSAQGRDSRGFSLLPGVDLGETGRVYGAARIGWGRIDAAGAGVPGLEDVVGRAGIAFRVGAGTTLRLEGRREPGFTTSGDDVYFLETRVGVRALHYFSRLWGFDAGTSEGHLSFPGSSTGSERSDDLDGYDAGLRLRLVQDARGRQVEYRIKLQHWRRDSTEDGLDQTRTVVGFGADIGF